MRCPACRSEVDPGLTECPHCREPFKMREPDDGGVSTLIPYRNAKALVAYYFGVFSLIPCLGAGLGPAALILGILGLRYANRNPTAKGTGHAIVGIVLGSLVSLAHLGILVLMLIGAASARR